LANDPLAALLAEFTLLLPKGFLATRALMNQFCPAFATEFWIVWPQTTFVLEFFAFRAQRILRNLSSHIPSHRGKYVGKFRAVWAGESRDDQEGTTKKEIEAARAFLAQWPEGPQV
jgi:hypothetical protein